MSLYVRLQTSFWTHRKTLRLKARIGDAAFWVPPRLWSYAAEHQPDGDFSDFTAEEIASLIGYSGDAKALLCALENCQFIEAMLLCEMPRCEREQSKSAKQNKDLRKSRLALARALATHSKEEWDALVREFGGICVCCEKKKVQQKDHILPIYLGGSDGIDNLQPLCESCNASKGPDDFNWVEFRRKNRVE